MEWEFLSDCAFPEHCLLEAHYKCYKRIGYDLNVMRQSACLVSNPIMVENYAAFFNFTPVGRASSKKCYVCITYYCQLLFTNYREYRCQAIPRTGAS